ncbi:MAG: fasciclin domain-containing protein, partial [Akkermansiaceae bacterium]|nr:fasciclin domain-containing protein [Akkermansiaceae bacterium]
EGTVARLLKEENLGQLKSILTYHAFDGSVSAGDALNAQAAKTLNGQSVSFSIEKGRLKANKATIVTTDIACDNGTIHVIDAVLLPPDIDSDAEVSSTESEPDPRKMIEAAIKRGVPVFNKGQHGSCAAIYERCLEGLAENERLESGVRAGLRKVLDRSRSSHRDWDRAWIFRHALDGVYHDLMARR